MREIVLLQNKTLNIPLSNKKRIANFGQEMAEIFNFLFGQ
jgi:hypothetical protein